jgi:hypothetical protein
MTTAAPLTAAEFREYLAWLQTPEAGSATSRWVPQGRGPRPVDSLDQQIAGLRLRAMQLRADVRPMRDPVSRPKLVLLQGGRDAS